MTHLGLLSILPPVLALALALWKKKIIPALLVGGLAAAFLLAASRWTFVVDYLERVIKVTGDRGNLQLILFGVLVGGLIKLMETSGGFKGMIALLESLNIRTKRPVFILTWAIGLLMILENYSNIMVNGTTVGSLYDKTRHPARQAGLLPSQHQHQLGGDHRVQQLGRVLHDAAGWPGGRGSVSRCRQRHADEFLLHRQPDRDRPHDGLRLEHRADEEVLAAVAKSAACQ